MRRRIDDHYHNSCSCSWDNLCVVEIHRQNGNYVLDEYWKFKIRVCRRWKWCYYSGKLGQRAFFTGPHWATFVKESHDIDVAVQRAIKTSSDILVATDTSWSQMRCLSVTSDDGMFVKRTSLYPTLVGIALTYSQWNNLKQALIQIEKEVPQLTAILPCWHDIDSHCDMDRSRCHECTPSSSPDCM